MGPDLGAATERSEVSRSFGVERRSDELEEAEVTAEVEDDNLPIKVDQDSVLVVVIEIGCCSKFTETASLFDVRRTVGAVDGLFSAF